jgi:hypothetical protein
MSFKAKEMETSITHNFSLIKLAEDKARQSRF